MTASMAPEELAAIDAHMAREQYITRRDALRLLAEVRRLQAERDAAPPVGQTVEEAIADAEAIADEVGDTGEMNLKEWVALKIALSRARSAITARDAEVARAAAEREREAIVALIDGGSFLHDKAPTRLFANEVIAAIRRSRAPAPADRHDRVPMACGHPEQDMSCPICGIIT